MEQTLEALVECANVEAMRKLLASGQFQLLETEE